MMLVHATLALAALLAPQSEAPGEDAVAWQGPRRAALAERPSELLDLEDAAIEAAVLEVRRAAETARDFDAALADLGWLRLRAARAGTEDAERLLVLVAVARARVLLEVGRYREAEDALTRIWPTASELQELEPGALHARPEAQVAALRRARAAAEWRDVRARLELLSGDADTEDGMAGLLPADRLAWVEEHLGRPGREVADVVRDALTDGDWVAIQGLGVRATPALAVMVLSNLDEPRREFRTDPLDPMFTIDSRATARLCARWIDAGGASWRRRVMNLVHANRKAGLFPLDQYGLWRRDPGEVRGGVYHEPEWLDVLAALVADPVLRDHALVQIRVVCGFDGLTPGLVDALGALVAGPAREPAVAVLEAIDLDWRVPSARPVYARGLAHPDPDLRARSASALAEFDAEELVAHVADPAPAVRAAVARSLGARTAVVRKSSGTKDSGHTDSNHPVVPELTPARADALRALLADGDAEVQAAAMTALASQPAAPVELWTEVLASGTPRLRVGLARRLQGSLGLQVPTATLAAVCRRLVADEDPAVRAELVGVRLPDVDLKREVLVRLAGDPSPLVLSALDESLSDWRLGDPSVSCEVLARRMRNAAVPFRPHGGGPSGWTALRKELDGETVEALTLVRIGLEHGIDPALSEGLQTLRAMGWAAQEGEFAFAEALLELEPEELARVFAWTHAADGDLRTFASRAVKGEPRAFAALRLLFTDPTVPARVRVEAGAHLDVTWSEAGAAALLELAAAPEWSDGTIPVERLGGFTYDSTKSNALLVRVLADARIAPPVAASLADILFADEAPGEREAARAVLGRWLGEPDAPFAVQRALATLGRGEPDEWTEETLVRASRDPRTMAAAVRAMDRLGGPRFLEPLGAVLRSRALIGSGEETTVQALAAQALVRYGSPRAEELLREGIPMAHPTARPVILNALETLRLYLAGAGTAVASRDEALAEVVGLLASASPAVRAEAARSLPVFGAVETIPLLLPMLEDDDPDVRAAVRAALEDFRRDSERPADDAGAEVQRERDSAPEPGRSRDT